jgi:hypothetical protein
MAVCSEKAGFVPKKGHLFRRGTKKKSNEIM